MATLVMSEGFESYTSGQVLDNVGGWRGWDNNSSVAGVVSDEYAYSGSNSILIAGDTDAIYPLTGVTSGLWEVSTWQYIPTSSFGYNYFIIQNKYNDNGPYEWALQTRFDNFDKTVKDLDRSNSITPIIYDQWTEILNVIDLDANTLLSYYNDTLISSGTFTVNSGDSLEIANIDLYAVWGTAYYDEITVTRVSEPATLILLSLGLISLTLTSIRRLKPKTKLTCVA